MRVRRDHSMPRCETCRSPLSYPPWRATSPTKTGLYHGTTLSCAQLANARAYRGVDLLVKVCPPRAK